MSVDLLVVGLGNPDDEFRHTRHNVGADVVEILASRHGARLKVDKLARARIDTVTIGGRRVTLAVPLTYMNDSGIPVSKLVRRFGIEPSQVVVVQDELDLAPAALKVKEGGGLAGHNGLRSIVAHLKSDEFLRVRIGVGKPVTKAHGRDHVLNRFNKRERAEIDVTLELAADAVECIVSQGVAAAMNTFNTTPDPEP